MQLYICINFKLLFHGKGLLWIKPMAIAYRKLRLFLSPPPNLFLQKLEREKGDINEKDHHISLNSSFGGVFW